MGLRKDVTAPPLDLMIILGFSQDVKRNAELFILSRPPSVIDLGSPTFRPSDFHGIRLWSKREFLEKVAH
jgi:hypothetical protein